MKKYYLILAAATAMFGLETGAMASMGKPGTKENVFNRLAAVHDAIVDARTYKGSNNKKLEAAVDKLNGYEDVLDPTKAPCLGYPEGDNAECLRQLSAAEKIVREINVLKKPPAFPPLPPQAKPVPAPRPVVTKPVNKTEWTRARPTTMVVPQEEAPGRPLSMAPPETEAPARPN